MMNKTEHQMNRGRKGTRRTSIARMSQKEARFCLAVGLAITLVIPLFLHVSIATSRTTSVGTISSNNLAKEQKDKEGIWNEVLNSAELAEKAILDFFHGDRRALENGVLCSGGGGKDVAANTCSSHHIPNLSSRLLHRITKCRQQSKQSESTSESESPQKNTTQEKCVLRIVFVGSAQTFGRDMFHNLTHPFHLETRLRPIAQAAGLTLQVHNHAMDSDLSREGPQSNHMCIDNLVGSDVDVIGWDHDAIQTKPSAQVEAFLRWSALALQPAPPALILLNRGGGPHGASRRGKKRILVRISTGHNAIVYDEHVLPAPRSAEEDPYRNSSVWKVRWENEKNNAFYFSLMDAYSPFMDLVAIDPVGSMWHLDHLEEFSNGAMEEGKALPLFDCGSPPHDPPCDRIPKFISKHLAEANRTNATLPEDYSGAGCGGPFGCRHSWYGGVRSHVLRGELNALAIVRAFRDAATMALDSDSSPKIEKEQSATSRETIEQGKRDGGQKVQDLKPKFCSKEFCNRVPTCMTSYEPNLGLKLGEALVETEVALGSGGSKQIPLKGAAHYANKASFQVKDIDRRAVPFGYIDRKYAYHLAVPGNADKRKKKRQKNKDEEEEEVPSATISFTVPKHEKVNNKGGGGLVVLCEPPCYIDSCTKRQKKPLLDYVTLELDGNDITRSNESKQRKGKRIPSAVEVGGKFCSVIAKSIPAGDHLLRISTNVTYPDYVMFSHLITFT